MSEEERYRKIFTNAFDIGKEITHDKVRIIIKDMIHENPELLKDLLWLDMIKAMEDLTIELRMVSRFSERLIQSLDEVSASLPESYVVPKEMVKLPPDKDGY